MTTPTRVTVSMDGLRKNIASNFSDTQRALEELFAEMGGAYEHLTGEVKDAMNSLNSSICGLLCVYNEDEEHYSNLGEAVDDLLPETFDME